MLLYHNEWLKSTKILLAITAIVSLSLFIFPGQGFTVITGPCVDCHTMHNSQDGKPMADLGPDGQPWTRTEEEMKEPLYGLIRGVCLGCHGMATGNKIETVGTSDFPQVFHSDVEDLAGGNFAHIDSPGPEGDSKGHNVVDLENPDDILVKPPGAIIGKAVGIVLDMDIILEFNTIEYAQASIVRTNPHEAPGVPRYRGDIVARQPVVDG